jgi:hypothetical protein
MLRARDYEFASDKQEEGTGHQSRDQPEKTAEPLEQEGKEGVHGESAQTENDQATTASVY